MIGMKKKDVQNKKPKGRIRRWLKANRLPLLSFALVATIAGAMAYKFCPKESRSLILYKKGLISFTKLPIKDKFKVWRDRLIDGKCGENHTEVISEAQEEYLHQLKLGNEKKAKRIFLEMEFYINDGTVVKKDPNCLNKRKKDSP